MSDYDQCVAVRESSNSFCVQCCFIDLCAPLPSKLKHVKIRQPLWNYAGTVLDTVLELVYISGVTNGICIPSSCKADDLRRIIKGLMKGFYKTTSNITDVIK